MPAKSRRSRPFLTALLLVTLLATSATTMAAAKPEPVTIQILAVNDFHGALDPSSTTISGVNYWNGGAEYLANFVQAAAATNPNTVKVSVGDMVGASPLLSALFHDEPTVMAFNQMGFDFNVTGNHEFDEGWQELLRLQNGGCHPTDGCIPGVPAFPGADFEYLSANVIRLDNGQTLFPSIAVREFNGVKVGFIGVALESTPTIVVPSAVAGLEFLPEVETINRYVKVLKDTEGIKAIVVLLHDGVGSSANASACNLNDPFFANVVMNIDPEVDALITGHSHLFYNCQVKVKKNYDPMLVTSAQSNGRYLTSIALTVNATNGQVSASSATNTPVLTPKSSAVPNAAMKALLDQYRAVAAPLANVVIGSITADIVRAASFEESALGDVIADAQLAWTSAPGYGGAVVAMTNPGGIRTDLTYNQSSGGEAPGEVTFGEAFAVQPFSNSLVTMDLTGAQLKEVLEQQASAARMLQVSASLTYTWTASASPGSQVSNLMVNGIAVDPTASYRITVNNFLAAGGDGFSKFTAGTNLLIGGFDVDALVGYLMANSPVAPGPKNRITRVP